MLSTVMAQKHLSNKSVSRKVKTMASWLWIPLLMGIFKNGSWIFIIYMTKCSHLRLYSHRHIDFPMPLTFLSFWRFTNSVVDCWLLGLLSNFKSTMFSSLVEWDQFDSARESPEGSNEGQNSAVWLPEQSLTCATFCNLEPVAFPLTVCQGPHL